MSPTLQPIALADRPTLVNLLELYCHDFSEFMEVPVDSTGRFNYPLKDDWWQSPNKLPFFIRIDDALAGFALISRGSAITGASDVTDITEFFVLRGLRRHGIGRLAAHQVFGKFPGPWEVRVRTSNTTALRFWAGAIASFLKRDCAPDEWAPDGVSRKVFRFGG